MVSALRGPRFFRLVGAIVGLGIFAAVAATRAAAQPPSLTPHSSSLRRRCSDDDCGACDESPAPTIAPTTTVVSDLFLRAGGVGAFNFGVAPGDLIAALMAVYGSPSADFIVNYVADSTYGYLRADDGSDSYVALGEKVGVLGRLPPDACRGTTSASTLVEHFDGAAFHGLDHSVLRM